MFRSAKYFVILVGKYRLGLLFTVSMVLVITLMLKILSMDPYENSRASSTISTSAISEISDPCLVTHTVQAIRERENTSHINPARHVVDELLEIITFTSTICPTKKEDEHLVVAIVNSARDNYNARQVIRRTWGSLLKYKDWHVRIVFLLGQSDHCLNSTEMADQDIKNFVTMEEKSLTEEHNEHGDIVIGAFTDSYRNLTYKHLMGYKFVLEHCPEADWIVKTDDDVFVNLPVLLNMRTKEFSRNGSQPSNMKPFDIYCHIYFDKPTRCKDCPTGKWFSTREEWPDDTYPLFCLGNDYAISMDWMKRIYSVRGLGGFFWVDDVFIMGKLREIAEKTYNDTTRKFSIWTKVNDLRQSVYTVIEECKKNEIDVDFFALLLRFREFEMEMECIWKKALGKANVNAILVSKN